MLRQRLKVQGLAGKVQVCSAGSSVGQPGRPPDPRILRLAAAQELPFGRIRARPLELRHALQSDFILAMEQRHLDAVTWLAAGRELRARPRLLGEFLPPSGGNAPGIPDPYYGDVQGFSHVFELLDAALEGLLDEIHQRLG